MVPNLLIAADRLTSENTTAAREKERRRVKSQSRLSGAHFFTRVLSAVTVIHVKSGISISCKARCEFINGPASVHVPAVGDRRLGHGSYSSMSYGKVLCSPLCIRFWLELKQLKFTVKDMLTLEKKFIVYSQDSKKI